MQLKQIDKDQKETYNQQVRHIMQSWEWGEFRQNFVPVLRYGIFSRSDLIYPIQMTLHKIPATNKFIGYFPKGPFPSKDLIDGLVELGKKYNCVAIKLEPNILIKDTADKIIDPRLKKASKSLFTKNNFLLDITPTEDEILKNMHPKTRYNIKVAQKHNVVVEERTDEESFNIYLKLYFETTLRQKYHGHNKSYHQKVWQTLKKDGMARILIAFYTPSNSNERIPLTAWMLFNFQDTLYYPYGGSSIKYRNVMSSTLVAWEAIRLGKRLKLKTFDLWGALPPNADIHHPWQGFHRFKEGLGGELVEYMGSYDLIFNPLVYHTFNQVDKFMFLKILLLKTFKS